MAEVKIDWFPEQASAVIRQATLRGVIKGANIIRNEILRLIQDTPKTGRVYVRRGISHQASAPGEPPASDTGNLVQNITVMIDAEHFSAVVNSGAEYADALEFGTLKTEPRPYMRVALENKRAEVEAAVNDEVSKALEGG